MKTVFEELKNIEKAIAKAREALENDAYNSRDVFTEADLAEAIKDNLEPDVVAILAAKIQHHEDTGDPHLNAQLDWFTDLLANMVGGRYEAETIAIKLNQDV